MVGVPWYVLSLFCFFRGWFSSICGQFQMASVFPWFWSPLYWFDFYFFLHWHEDLSTARVKTKKKKNTLLVWFNLKSVARGSLIAERHRDDALPPQFPWENLGLEKIKGDLWFTRGHCLKKKDVYVIFVCGVNYAGTVVLCSYFFIYSCCSSVAL